MASCSRIVISLCLVWVLSGCTAPAFLGPPNLGQRISQLRKIALLPPTVDVFEIGAGGVLEKMDDWSRTGTDNVLRAFSAELDQRRGVQISRVAVPQLPEPAKVDLEQTQLLFDAVVASIVPHVYGIPAQRFDDKITHFDYSLGADIGKINVTDVDAFVIAKGTDHISSAGRKTLQMTTMLAAAAMGVIIIPQGGVTAMNVALVDARTGDILWYKMKRSDGVHDLRDFSSATSFVREALSGIPLR